MSDVSSNTADVLPWPAHHLEAVPECPICKGGSGRDLWHGEMTDRVFGIAPGAWSLYRCRDCGSGWLDPRPDAASLPQAYAGYFTHGEIRERVIVRRRGIVRRWLHDALNDYMNHRYGTRRVPASAYGHWLTWLLPPLRAAVDATCRHLPRAPAGGGLLLDVGCGNGAFLRLAREMGWNVTGLDFDPEAVEQARNAGFEAIVGGVEALDTVADRYDVITLSHVIEHVGDPNDTLACLYRLLKPGGMLWLETPNLGSLGHQLYGRDWRGLEPPRHLVLCNAQSLRTTLSRTGFVDIRQRWNAMVSFEVLRASSAIRHGRVAANAGSNKKQLPREIMVEATEALLPARREFLTFTAKKACST